MEIQLEFIKKKRSGQSLIEIVVAIALAAFFMGSTIVGLGFSSTRYSGYVQKKQAFDILKKQKSSNEVNLGRFLSQYKNISGYSSLNAFPYQGAHQTYTYLNYLTDNQSLSAFLNEEKKFFDNDKPIGYWSLDAIPTSTTYILDDSGKTSLKGTLTCLGSPCNNPYVISPSLGRCVHNDCMQFTGDSNGGSVVTFEDNTTLNNMKKITWEA